jgi:DNA polymerase-3 subunit epsilon
MTANCTSTIEGSVMQPFANVAGFLFTDLETSGLDAKANAIMQIGAIITDRRFKILGSFMSLMKPEPGQIIEPKALEVTGFRLEDFEEAPPQKQVMEAFCKFALSCGEPLAFAGFNCPFDLSFLDASRERCGIINAPYSVPWLDLLPIARKELKLPSHKLVHVADHLGVSIGGAHDALVDSLTTIKVARALFPTATMQRLFGEGNRP